MATLIKKPLQVYLRPEQLDALRSLAKRRRASLAELIRQGVDRLLAELPGEEDPLWDIIALGQGGPSDLSEKHDEYLARFVAEENT